MESLSTILFSLYRGTAHHDQWLIACLEGAWQGILGDRLAQICRPVAMRNQELLIEVLDAAWLLTLLSMKPELQQRVHSASGNAVQTIRFQLKTAV